jgi:formate dehydrogenase subunit gamma
VTRPGPEVFRPERAAEIIAAGAREEGATLPILHALQQAFGCVPDAAIPMLAEALNRTRAEVYGVVGFYRDFRREPAGRHVLKLCRAEACQAMGGEALAAQAQAALGIGWDETTRDRALTLEPVYCLGLCATAPAALLDGRPVGRLTRERLALLLEETQG